MDKHKSNFNCIMLLWGKVKFVGVSYATGATAASRRLLVLNLQNIPLINFWCQDVGFISG